MRSQVRGGDNDKLCYSAVSDRETEMEKEKRRIKRQDQESNISSENFDQKHHYVFFLIKSYVPL